MKLAPPPPIRAWIGLLCSGLTLSGCVVLGVQPWWPGSRVEGELRVDDRREGQDFGPVVVYLESWRRVEEPLAPSRQIRVKHDGRRFQPRLSVLGRGEKLELLNDSGLHHRLFWLVGDQRHEVWLPPESGTRAMLELSEPGLARLYCELHDDEHFSVFVAPSHLYDVLDEPGHFAISAVPPGSWRLHVWSEAGEGEVRQVEVSALAVSRKQVQIDATRFVRR